MTTKAAPRRLTKLGGAIMAFSAQRGNSTRAELVRVLNKGGYDFNYGTVGDYLTGEYSPPREFLQAITKVLGLTHEERITLGSIFVGDED